MIDPTALIIAQAEYWLDFLADPAAYPLPEDDLQGAARALDNLAPLPDQWDMTIQMVKTLHFPMEHRGYWRDWDGFLHSLLPQAAERADIAAQMALLTRRARILRLREQRDAALAAYLRAWRIARQNKDVAHQAVALTNLADIYQEDSLFWRASTICQHAVTLFEQVGDAMRRAYALNTLGLIYIQQHCWPQAARYLQQAVAAFEALEHADGSAKAYNHLGILYGYQKQYDKALDALFRALDYYIKIDNPFEASQVCINIGYTYIHLRDFEHAEMILGQAETTLRELHYLYHLAQVRHNLGIVYRELRNWREAKRCFLRALQVWQDLQDVWNLAHTLGEFAALYLAWGRWPLAEVYLTRAEHLIADEEITGAYATLHEELTERRRALDARPSSTGGNMSETLLETVEEIIAGPLSRDEKLRAVCAVLEREVPHYDWVGFYLVDPERERELVLGPYVGDPTDHTRIAFGEGICGQAADTETTFIIQDVSRETNYLSCSPNVRSEIVIPIFKDDRIVGELDIDSHALAPFTVEDQVLLEEIARRVAKLL